MKLQGEHHFDAPRDEVWKALLDPEVLSRTVPGSEGLEQTAENEFSGKLKMKIGPVQGVFQGKVALSELDPPSGWVSGTVSLLYQPTSWEYIQFLDLGNDRSVAFLADEGVNMLEAWIETGMAAPHTMATIEVPEPGQLAMLAAGIGVLSALARGRRRGRFAEGKVDM